MPIERIGQDFAVNNTFDGNQNNASVAVLADGRFVVVFESEDAEEASPDCIRARIFSPNGTPVDVDFIVNTTTQNDQDAPAVTALADGRFVVMWTSEDTGDGGISCIRARIFDGDGTPDATVNGGADFIVNTTTPGGQFGVTATVLPDGRFLATWSSGEASDGAGSCIRARIFNAGGTPDPTVNGGNDFIVNTTPDGNQTQSSASALPDGRFVVTWQSDDTGDGAGDCIRVRVFNADGTPDAAVNGGNDFVVDTTPTGNQSAPSVAALSDGRFVVAWQSPDSGDGAGTCIRARVFTAAGTPDPTVNGGNDFIVNTTFAGDQNSVAVAGLSAGQFLVTWGSTDTGDGGDFCVRGRLYTADGSAAGDDFIVNTTTPEIQTSPAVAPLADGHVAVTFNSPDEDGFGTRLQMFDLTVFSGTAAADVWKGTDFGDTITGAGDNDTLSGLAGHDVINGGAGSDALAGGAGDDKLLGGLGNDVLEGNAGAADVAIFAGTKASHLVSLLPNGGFQVTDLRAGSPNGTDEVYGVERLQFGDGTFVPSTIADNDLAALGDILWRRADGRVAAAISELGVLPGAVAIRGTGDFDRDGDGDILLRGPGTQVSIWELQGGAVADTHALPATATSFVIAGTGDFDADGDADILWRGSSGTTVIWEIDDAAFVTTHALPAGSGSFQVAATGDFDGDGDADILWRGGSATIVWELEDGAFVRTRNLGTVSNSFAVAGTGDFDDDGDADILWSHTSGQTVLWEMQGGALAQAHNFGVVSNSFQIRGVQDFDSDGDADILWRHTDGTVVTWTMEDNALQVARNFGVIVNTWQVAGTGEFA